MKSTLEFFLNGVLQYTYICHKTKEKKKEWKRENNKKEEKTNWENKRKI